MEAIRACQLVRDRFEQGGGHEVSCDYYWLHHMDLLRKMKDSKIIGAADQDKIFHETSC